MNQTNQSQSGNVFATATGHINVYQGAQPQRGLRLDTKVLLAVLPIDVVFFFYGMLSYSGRNTTADTWRAGLFLILLFTTAGMLGRWVRRRLR